MKLNVLVLYGGDSTFTSTVAEYLDSFRRYSQHNIFYASASQFNKCAFDMNKFDAVVVHYSIRLCYDVHLYSGCLSKYFYDAIKSFKGYKALFIQDEYTHTNKAKKMMCDLGFQLVYTCVPQEEVRKIYPESEFPNTEFVTVLTGYTNDPAYLQNYCRPLNLRDNMIVYRGRQLSFQYGNLAREKYLIGKEMKRICKMKGIKVDIECEDEKRIYGEGWYEFLANSRATLGTESGSNIFDFTGSIGEAVEIAIAQDPKATYEKIFDSILAKHEGLVKMNQISPKIFESISLRTALILFEGDYSNIIEPNRHYIPLKKDWSNIEEVFGKLNDIDYLEELTERAFQEIIVSGKYSYANFIKMIDDQLMARVQKINPAVDLEEDKAFFESYDFSLNTDFHGRQKNNALENSNWKKSKLRSFIIGLIPPFMRNTIGRFRNRLLGISTMADNNVVLKSLAPENGLFAEQSDIDAVNEQFWSELCGTGLAMTLGIKDHSLESLKRFDQAYFDMYPYLLKHVPLEELKGKKVLEVGLGYGSLSQKIAESCAEYTGLDIAKGPVKMVQHRLNMLNLPGKTVQGSMLNSSIPSNSMDVVVSIGCFHHTGDVEKCIKETHRILRDGGKAMIMVYNRFSLRQWRNWPLQTFKQLMNEFMSPQKAVQSLESQKAAYDASHNNVAAPETIFLSKKQLKKMFDQYSQVKIGKENCDGFYLFNTELIKREALLKNVGKFAGLDIYIQAQKN